MKYFEDLSIPYWEIVLDKDDAIVYTEIARVFLKDEVVHWLEENGMGEYFWHSKKNVHISFPSLEEAVRFRLRFSL